MIARDLVRYITRIVWPEIGLNAQLHQMQLPVNPAMMCNNRYCLVVHLTSEYRKAANAMRRRESKKAFFDTAQRNRHGWALTQLGDTPSITIFSTYPSGGLPRAPHVIRPKYILRFHPRQRCMVILLAPVGFSVSSLHADDD